MENCYFRYMKLWVILMLAIFPTLISSIKVAYYIKTCPQAELIVQQVVQQRFKEDKSVTAALLRMHFHDCFVRGCDASLLLDSTNTNRAEKEAGANQSVREFSLIDEIKSKLESACPETVSCADIIALATRDAVALSGGPAYRVLTGRLDGVVSRASEVNLPGPGVSVQQAIQSFAAKGLSRNEMITLLGAHTVGVAHCNFFQDRISNFRGSGAPDPSMDGALVNKLKGICGNPGGSSSSVSLDQGSEFIFDNQFYNQLKLKRGILKIDQELAIDRLSSSFVSELARNNTFFKQRFSNAIIKMSKIQDTSSSRGEIRKKCRVINNPNNRT